MPAKRDPNVSGIEPADGAVIAASSLVIAESFLAMPLI
jgi:hypothetical protein